MSSLQSVEARICLETFRNVHVEDNQRGFLEGELDLGSLKEFSKPQLGAYINAVARERVQEPWTVVVVWKTR